MFHSTPPKSRTTARRLVASRRSALVGRARFRRPRSPLHRRRPLVRVGGDRDPPASLQTLLVQHLVLGTGRLVALELRDRVVAARLVPLLLRLGGARGQRERDHREEEHPSCHGAHDTMRTRMLKATIAGSLPKPAWLATPGTLWAPWLLEGRALDEGKRDAVVLALRDQEVAGIDIVPDGEQTRRHFVWGFVERIEGIDFSKMVTIGIRADRYQAEVPTVVGPVRRRGPIHSEEARFARAQTRRELKW